MFSFILLSIIMHFASFTFVLSFLVLGLRDVVMGQALGAFYSSLGPGVVVLDPVNREFVYNFHTETGFHQMQRIKPNVLPKNSTDIGVTGYSNSANIFVSEPHEDDIFLHLPFPRVCVVRLTRIGICVLPNW